MASGKSTNTVNQYLNKITNKYKDNPEKKIINTPYSFYSLKLSGRAYKNKDNLNISDDYIETSWRKDGSSGVLEMEDSTVKPNITDRAKEARNCFRNASKYIAKMIPNS